jgi:hypothetical protein
MGINAEMVRIVLELRRDGIAKGDSVLEFGAQDICAAPDVIKFIFDEHGRPNLPEPVLTAKALYTNADYQRHISIDAIGQDGALVYDLNKDLVADFGFIDRFDLVTNLGTAEHCFNQFQFFKNIHDTCSTGGLMIHASPCAGNVNHGFYNYHPRFFADLAAANGYEMLRMAFTVDYTPKLFRYDPATFRRFDSRDLLLYVVLRKTSDTTFKTPFDGMFAAENALTSYRAAGPNPLSTDFAPYLKGAGWQGTKGYAELPWWRRVTMRKVLARLPLSQLIRR